MDSRPAFFQLLDVFGYPEEGYETDFSGGYDYNVEEATSLCGEGRVGKASTTGLLHMNSSPNILQTFHTLSVMWQGAFLGMSIHECSIWTFLCTSLRDATPSDARLVHTLRCTEACHASRCHPERRRYPLQACRCAFSIGCTYCQVRISVDQVHGRRVELLGTAAVLHYAERIHPNIALAKYTHEPYGILNRARQPIKDLSRPP